MNRTLPVGIVIYRYVYVCRSSWIGTAYQRKMFNLLIGFSILVLSTFLTVFCVIYREKSFHYLRCIGNEDFFHDQYEQYDQYGLRLVWLLPIYHPFHLLSLLAFFSYAFIVPLGYICIYRFRKRMNRNVKGLSEQSRNVRKGRNLVTTKCNMIIWMCELISGFSILLFNSNFFLILYFSLPSTVSPILYCAGILENREAMRSHLMDIFKESKRKGDKYNYNLIRFCKVI